MGRVGGRVRQIARLLERDGNLRHWCRQPFTTNRRSLYRVSREHIVPRSHGGPNDDENMLLAGQTCNSTRGSVSYTKWRAAIDEAMRQRPECPNEWALLALRIVQPVKPPCVFVVDPTWEPGTF